jgi:hypothetical protein
MIKLPEKAKINKRIARVPIIKTHQYSIGVEDKEILQHKKD